MLMGRHSNIGGMGKMDQTGQIHGNPAKVSTKKPSRGPWEKCLRNGRCPLTYSIGKSNPSPDVLTPSLVPVGKLSKSVFTDLSLFKKIETELCFICDEIFGVCDLYLEFSGVQMRHPQNRPSHPPAGDWMRGKAVRPGPPPARGGPGGGAARAAPRGPARGPGGRPPRVPSPAGPAGRPGPRPASWKGHWLK